MANISILGLAIAGLLLVITTVFLRLIYIHPKLTSRRKVTKSKKDPSHIVIVLGSGGHTAEMMSVLRDLNPRRYTHRTYIVSSGDNFSTAKAAEIERRIQSQYLTTVSTPGVFSEVTGVWDVKIVPRARKIHQPLYTAPVSSLACIVGCLRALNEARRTSRACQGEYPDVIITNGPATAVIVLFAAFFLKLLGVAPAAKMKSIYVESWARISNLSLSGKVLLQLGICDRFLVQWEALANKINVKRVAAKKKKKVEWLGFLVE